VSEVDRQQTLIDVLTEERDEARKVQRHILNVSPDAESTPLQELNEMTKLKL